MLPISAIEPYPTPCQHERLTSPQNGVDILIPHLKLYLITNFEGHRPNYVAVSSSELSHGDRLGAAVCARYGRCTMLLGNNAHLSCGCHALM